MSVSEPSRFVGRARELGELERVFGEVKHPFSDRPGRAVAIRGRRRVGKSRLVTEFARKTSAPSFYYLAIGASVGAELSRFIDALAVSSLPGARAVADFPVPTTWSQALTMLSALIPSDTPSVVVIDEVPYMARRDDGFEGSLQAAWDSSLAAKPVMLLLVGSNQSEMERLTSHGRPFFGRSVDTELRPLRPKDVMEATGLSAPEAIDAYLITGGFPPLVTAWERETSVAEYLETALSSSLSPLIAHGERVLASEFAVDDAGSDVLRAIGSDSRTFTTIGRASGVTSEATLSRALDALTSLGVVTKDVPLAAKAANYGLYRIADP
jgi:AAA+ ATPase superfamily predicted ATPase